MNRQKGYAWLCTPPRRRLLLFRQTPAASVLQQVFGKPWLPGCLVVDRKAGDNKASCAIQYCYSHLLHEVQDLEKEFPRRARSDGLCQYGGPATSPGDEAMHPTDLGRRVL